MLLFLDLSFTHQIPFFRWYFIQLIKHTQLMAGHHKKPLILIFWGEGSFPCPANTIGTRTQHIAGTEFEPRKLASSEVCSLMTCEHGVTWSNYTGAGFDVAHQLCYMPSISEDTFLLKFFPRQHDQVLIIA